MAVLIETSKGDIVIDLFVEECPVACKNFLSLCKTKYYNNCLFHNVQPNFLVQTGDPTGTGKGGDSIYKTLYGDQARCFDDEIKPTLKHKNVGVVGMASAGPNLNASQFYITTAKDLQSLDEKHTIFGQLAEGEDALMRINEAYCDEEGRPFQNIRIKHTVILDDPMDEPAGLGDLIPDLSPVFERDPEDTRLEDDWVPSEDNRPAEEVEKSLREAEAKSRAIMLEMIGDLPDADVKPPEEVLFVCRLNPVTSDEDLEIIFGRFGKITDCEVIRDFKTGESLQYAFIGFETKEQSEAAYLKMDNVLIDDRRIHVDFSQSVSKMWNRYKRVGAKDDASAAMSL
ncbi:cytochrome P450 monooxygenase 59, partial [Cymbomonas tetramitiformis]